MRRSQRWPLEGISEQASMTVDIGKFSVLATFRQGSTARGFEGFIAPGASCQRNCGSAIAPTCSSSKPG
jgi:hypothetical protein